MRTIGAKELRLHLDQIFDRVTGGEEIVVTHRFKGSIRLSANGDSKPKKQKLAGLQAFDTAPKQKSPYNPNKPIKELYDESITRKYTS